MKVSLANLLLLINQKEKEVSELYSEVLKNTIVVKDRELDGRETILNEVEDFGVVIDKYEAACDELVKYKNILATNNATVKTESGYTIIEAINKVSVLRRKLNLYDNLVTKKPSLSRQSDGNGISSYYRINDLNFDLELEKQVRLETQNEIAELEVSIQQANANTIVEI